jgi:lysozyme
MTISAIVGVVAILTVSEGVRHVPYSDQGGVLTVCYGSTKDVVRGKYYSYGDCADRLVEDLAAHKKSMDECLLTPDAIPENTYQAFLDFTYNVGATSFCQSTAKKLLDAGRYKEACAELSKWVYVDGKVSSGLKARRRREAELCSENLPEQP